MIDPHELAANLERNIARASIWPSRSFNTTSADGHRDAVAWIAALCVPADGKAVRHNPPDSTIAPSLPPRATQTGQVAPVRHPERISSLTPPQEAS